MSGAEAEIRDVIEAYVTGFNRGDAAALRRGFHRRGVSAGFFQGELQWDSADDFAEFCAAAAPDPDGPVPPHRIEALSVSGDTAIAVVADRWGERRFRDSLTLIRADGRWQIVFKAFHIVE